MERVYSYNPGAHTGTSLTWSDLQKYRPKKAFYGIAGIVLSIQISSYDPTNSVKALKELI